MFWQMVVLHVVTFLAIVFALRRLLYAESAKEARRLKELKDEAFLKQRELDERIREAGEVYTQRVRQANEEISRLKVKAEAELEERSARIIDEAEREADRIMKAAFNAKEKMCEEIAEGMKRKAPELAVRIFERLLSENVRVAVHRELVKEMVETLPEIEVQFNSGVEDAEVCCAYPLLPEEVSALEEALCSRLGRRLRLVVKEDSQLVAGVVLRIGSLEIDGDLSSRLAKIEEEMRNS